MPNKVFYDAEEVKGALELVGAAIERLVAGPQYKTTSSSGRLQYVNRSGKKSEGMFGTRIDIGPGTRDAVQRHLIPLIKERFNKQERHYYQTRSAVDLALGRLAQPLPAHDTLREPDFPYFTAGGEAVPRVDIPERILGAIEVSRVHYMEDRPGFWIGIGSLETLQQETTVESKGGRTAPLWDILEHGSDPHIIHPLGKGVGGANALALYRHGMDFFMLSTPGRAWLHPGQEGRHFFLDVASRIYNEDRQVFLTKVQELMRRRLLWLQGEVDKRPDRLKAYSVKPQKFGRPRTRKFKVEVKGTREAEEEYTEARVEASRVDPEEILMYESLAQVAAKMRPEKYKGITAGELADRFADGMTAWVAQLVEDLGGRERFTAILRGED